MRSQLTLVFALLLFSQCGEATQSADFSYDTDPTGKNIVQSDHLDFYIDTLATGLQNPWGMEFLPDGRILICERPGRLRVYQNNRLSPVPIENLPEVWAHGQGGLLDVVIHPEYEQNGWIYLAYAAIGQGNNGNLAISRARLEGNRLTDVERIFHGQPHTSARVHFGTRLVFDDEGYLFFSIGDRGNSSNAQKLDNHNGKVLRIYDDGSVPQDNPFVNTAGALPEIWAYGSRNIQGMQIHPETRVLWSHEHGPKGGDEINIIKKGANYAWPKATYGVNYNGTTITDKTSLEGTEDPVLHWTPSIAPCGMDFVTSEQYPGWKNNILVGALAGQHIHRVSLSGDEVDETEKILQGFARFRAIVQGPDGYIYVLTEEPGLFLKIVSN
nr:PQQ-dependent sugar dehydrogenase [Saprospiraceae bacterium]